MYVKRGLGLALALICIGGFGSAWTGCGGGQSGDDPDAGQSDGAAGSDAGNPDGGGGSDGGGSDGGTVVGDCTRTTSLSTSLLTSDVSYAKLVVDSDNDLLLAIPEYLSPSTDYLTGVILTPGSEAPVSITVTGAAPLAKVVSATYDAVAGHTVIFAYAMARPGDGGLGDHMELLTLAVSGSSGAITRLTPINPPTSQGFMFNMIYPEGDGVHYRAFRYAEASQRVAVSGGSATWEPEAAITTEGDFDWNYFTHDPTGNRLLVYGELTIEGMPPDFQMFLDPVVFELSLAGGTTWTRIMASGEAPPRLEDEYGMFSSQGIWDDEGARLVTLLDHWVYDPWFGDDIMVTGIWAQSDAGMWSVINEDTGSCCTNMWWGVGDHANRRLLYAAWYGLGGVDLAEGQEGQGISIPLGDAVLSAGVNRAVFDTTRGHLLATSSNGLLSMAVRNQDYFWRTADSGAAFPHEAAWGHALAYDAGGDRAVIFGGVSDYTSEATNATYTIALGAPSPSWTAATTSGTPPTPRRDHSAVVDPTTNTMYVVGGYRLDGATYTHYADVMALDLTTLAWSTVATLPTGRARPLLHLANSGADLYVLLGATVNSSGDPGALMDAYRITTATGAVETLTVSGDLPTQPASYLSGLALPTAFVILSPEPEGVALYTASFTPGAVTLTRTTACEEPRSLGYGAGVVDPQSGVGYVAGRTVWRLAE
ncbi:MAG: kelch repeat-containing protein [bacterium]